MENTYWHKQTAEEPLYPDLLWSRPENKRHAGKLLIIGGNLYGFSAPATAYQASVKAGIGTSRVLLPNALQKTVGKILENGEFAPSTPSGSFSQAALDAWLLHSAWADGVLLAGDLGRNSETAIVIEKLTTKYAGQLTITKDAIDYFYAQPKNVLERPNTTLVLSLAQLQKLLTQAHWPKAITFGMGLVQLIDALHELTTSFNCNIVVKHLENILVASSGQVSTTKLKQEQEVWRVNTATQVSVWWLQNSDKTFEALTTAVFQQTK
jgi:NAD(P)H-hydrate repair Nnr-like enzyme with NAD(P)H-hydrate dehydratase domain